MALCFQCPAPSPAALQEPPPPPQSHLIRKKKTHFFAQGIPGVLGALCQKPGAEINTYFTISYFTLVKETNFVSLVNMMKSILGTHSVENSTLDLG